MAYINHQDLALLNELLNDNLTAWEGEENSVKSEHRDIIKRLREFDEKHLPMINSLATQEECDKAREIFCKGWGEFADEIEIDDQANGVSRADDGVWVNAWVWVPTPKPELDWDKPVQWSTGEPVTFAPYDDSMPNHHVSACAEWTEVTGDSFVAVDDEGQILGCEDEGYPTIVNAEEENADG